MIKAILRALGLMRPAPAKKETIIKAADLPPKVKLKPLVLKQQPPGIDLLALQARFAKNEQNGKRRHHKAKNARA